MKIYTTLNKIKSFQPCKDGYIKLLTFLGKTSSDDEPVDYLTILESNGVEDTIWCMRCEWFEHKDTWMQFVNECVARVKVRANAAAYAAYAAYATAAAAAAYAAINADATDYATAYATERANQCKHLTELLS